MMIWAKVVSNDSPVGLLYFFSFSFVSGKIAQ